MQKAAYIYAMDRIIYFYKTREQRGGVSETVRHTVCRGEYELTFMGLPAEFVKRLEGLARDGKGEIALDRDSAAAGRAAGRIKQITAANFLLKMAGLFAGIVQQRRERRQQKEETLFWQQELETLAGLAGAGEECSFACEDRLLPLLAPEEGELFPAGDIWRKIWRAPLFREWFDLQWTERVLDEEGLPYFMVLGYHPQLPVLLYRYAAGMKGLKWILERRHDTEGLRQLLEDLYEEYGLTVSLKVLEEAEGYKKGAIVCREPACILDFSGDLGIPLGGIAEGSIWLDMGASEEKQRRVEGRNAGIKYFSLKKEWKPPVLP